MRKLLNLGKIFLFLCLCTTIASNSSGQDIQVRGKVTDASTGESLPGVSIGVKGTTSGTITDSDGIYQILVPTGTTLVFSYIGYRFQEKIIETTQTLDIALEPDFAKLEEIVVIGYGTVKKTDATGSVDVVSAKDFNKGAITSPQELLVGKMAGVIITSNDGAPGSGATIRIRGGSSMSASNDPLIVIDGVPVDNNEVSGLANPLSTINPNDIESVTVLKDASATAIYGSRASNGVIIITTKKGATGKLKVNYMGTASILTVPKTIGVLSADEYRELVETRFPDGASLLGNASTDWQKEIYETSFGHDHNLSLSGTTKKVPYRVSIGYTNQDGILKTSNIDRTTLALNASPSFFHAHLSLNINTRGSYSNTRFANTDAIGAAIQFDPTHPVKDNGKYQQGYFAWMDGAVPNDQAVDNPVAMLMLTSKKADVYRSTGNVQADYRFHFLPELRANLNLGYDYSETKGHNYTPDSTSWTTSFAGNIDDYTQTRKMELLEFYLNYTRQLDAISSKIDVTAGYSWQHFWLKKSDYQTNAYLTSIIADTYSKTQNYLVSFFGRLNYTFMERYLLTFTLRNDGSSRFAPDNRWGLFPSAAIAWKITSEPFMAHISAISDLKLRLGYGVTGQQDIGTNDYPYLARYTTSTSDNTAQYQLGGTFYNTLRPEGYDANIKWESTTTYNIGIDYGFFNNRISGTFDYYYRKTDDLLNTIPVPAGSNLTNELLTNVGSLENKGLEFAVNVKVLAGKDWLWEIGYNIGYNKNKITKLTLTGSSSFVGNATGSISGGVGNKIQINSVGYATNTFYVYKQIYDENGKPIEGLYLDQNNDQVINSSDLYRYKKAAPDVLMGISSRLSYKNWDLSFSGRASFGNYIYNNIASNRGTYYDVYNGGTNYLSNVVAQVNDTHFSTTQYFSDYYVENGSFFRMDYISLGYRLPNMIKNLNIKATATVQNAFIITRYKGLDPEVMTKTIDSEIFFGIDNNVYPRPGTFLVGLNIDF